MTDRNETLADIVAEMRAFDAKRGGRLYSWQIVEGFMRLLADRIEAAWKEERRILVADAENAKEARNRIGIKLRQEFADKCNECAATQEHFREVTEKVGNAAKMREALESTEELLEHFAKPGSILADAFAMHMRDNRAALAAPPRNCDVGTAMEQLQRFHSFCRVEAKGESCHGCQFFDENAGDVHCGFLWAQLPCETPAEKEGGAE